MPALDRIPFLDFGGSGPRLHFAHANGYPPGAYRPLLIRLANDYKVLAMHMRPLWPGARPEELQDWQILSEDLARFIDQQGLTKPIGAGHSMGATATLRLALQRPELFSALVLIDPVLLPPWAIFVWALACRLRLGNHLHPMVKGAQRRRSVFPSKETMFVNYREKEIFARIDDRELRVYIEAMARPGPNGQVYLAYSRAWEAHIYSTGVRGDMDIWRNLTSLKPPLLVIRGSDSNTFWERTSLRVKRMLPQASIQVIAGASHLAPLEKPDEAHALILKFILNLT